VQGRFKVSTSVRKWKTTNLSLEKREVMFESWAFAGLRGQPPHPGGDEGDLGPWPVLAEG
jgi:hypothetical protein